MPRLIDHDARDQQIAAAAMRVLDRDGLTALSVRQVAAEAGLATASLRRAFPTQDALRQFCLREVRDRVARRIAGLTGEGSAWVSAVLSELLPLDDTRRTELNAQLQLGVLAITDPALSEQVAALDAEVHGVCRTAIDVLDRTQGLRPELDPDIEATRLHALLDGVALHLLWNPDGPGREVLDRHLATLTR
ncbi:TetR family transcriptional regulator C-terminal domain-containing protein [Cellulomonas sp. NPDC089187]|uniref:TetR/AcrR family transcriptional regulator n=1 Tax=Cellulomonas sp. NPDC089187 TaxID=3154970 RepID=UPI00341EDC93